MVAQDNGAYDVAEAMCMRLMDFGAPAKEKAKALLREIRQFQVSRLGLDSLASAPYQPEHEVFPCQAFAWKPGCQEKSKCNLAIL